MQRNILLRVRQDIDREPRGCREVIVHMRALGDADDAERRLERTGQKGVRRHASDLAAGVGENHGDAGGKTAQHLAQQHAVDLARWPGRVHVKL